MRWPPSLRTRFVLLVVAGAVVPLALIGLWLTRTAARSGEELLRSRLVQTLDRSVQEVVGRWPSVRSDLLTISESPSVQRAVTGPPRSADAVDDAVRSEFPGSLRALTLQDLRGNIVWSERPVGGVGTDGVGPGLLVQLPVFAGRGLEQIGSLGAELAIAALLGETSLQTSPLGTVLAAFDPSTHASLLPLPFDAGMLEADRFSWGGDDWITDRRTLTEPPMVLVAAAPLTPLTEAFEEAARRGLLVLLVVAGVVIVMAVTLTGRMTRSLKRLAAAADAVSRGELDHCVESAGHDEIGRVAHAFNTMMESLRRTLGELADRRALAAVGEFAASLSHEVRNALTSIRLDLQVTGEQLPDGAAVKEPHERALKEVARLNETVTGALELARSGRRKHVQLDLWTPMKAAAHAARPEFAARHARLDLPESGEAITVAADAAALEQLFLNVLLNAAQALDEGGTAAVRIEAADGRVSVRIRDDGPGIPAEALDRVFEAFYSTRDGGTGLGLPIARRIAQAHGGQLRIHTELGTGTEVEITLPLAM
jgi:signal transduction histidine kinase